MSLFSIKIQGISQLEKALSANLQLAIQRGAPLVAAQVKREIAPYPPLSEANLPGRRGGWYERGYGPKWNSDPARRWKPDRKLPAGMKRRNVAYQGGWAGVKLSENMKHTWGIAPTPQGAILGNKATYAPLVHHYKDQASFHGRRGWITDKAACDAVVHSGKMDRIMQQVVKRILEGG